MSSADPIARGDALTIHPAADIFPVMDAEAFAKLAEDIRINGLKEAIWISQEGAILDGRHRYRACQETGVRPRFKFFEGTDPIAFVLSMNLHRRHLNESQRAMVAARVANLKKGRPQENGQICPLTQTEAAEALSISPRFSLPQDRVRQKAPGGNGAATSDDPPNMSFRPSRRPESCFHSWRACLPTTGRRAKHDFSPIRVRGVRVAKGTPDTGSPRRY